MSDLSWFRNRFPYTKLNDINLDWLLKRMKELSALVVSYADDIQRALTQSSTAITQSEAAVNSANNAVSIANSASATADAVSGIAEDARTIANAANNTAIHAETVANGIAETAQSALDTAQNAETIAGDAAQSAENAQTTAQNAVTIANGANTRAGNAEQSALTAISTASAAQQVATTAAQDAETAQQAATAASQNAQTAQQAATAAAQDAETAQQVATAAAQTATTAAQTATTAAQTATTAAQDAQTAQQAATTIAINKAGIIKETISANVVSFPDGADGLPLENLFVQIKPVQAGTGDPSPTNIRPISGWTGCNISQSGEDPSNPTVIAVSWQSDAGTVYGGFYNPITGILTVTWMGVLLSDLTWTYDADNTRFRANVAGILIGQTRRIPFYCSSFLPIDDGRGLGSVPNNAIYGAGSSNAIYIKTDAYTDAESFVAAMGNTQIIYPLRESAYITAQLEQHQMTTLYGINNFWADCGPVTVEFRADTKLYIEKINTPSDNDMIADAQITSGKYFIIGGNLYKSTTVIAQGDTIIPGSNCIETNLADALNSLI